MSRPTLLFLPGMLNTGAIFDRIAPVLAPFADVRIVDIFRQDSMAAMADHAWAIAGDGPIRLAGFSMGGYVALEMLSQQPGRIAGLALIDAGARAEAEEAKPMRERSIEAARRNFRKMCEYAIDGGLHPSRRDDPSLRDVMRAMMADIGADSFIAQVRAVMGRRDHRETLAAFHGSVAIICGREDAVTPLAWSEECARLAPDATLTIIEDAGHLTPLEQPRDVADALLRWLGAPASAVLVRELQ